MNVGQILETHMGWASRGLGIQIDEALKEIPPFGRPDAGARADAATAMATRPMRTSSPRWRKSGSWNAPNRCARGVPIATPVFDGAKEADVNDALIRAGFDKSGQSVVFDGRTGEKFARTVTVG